MDELGAPKCFGSDGNPAFWAIIQLMLVDYKEPFDVLLRALVTTSGPQGSSGHAWDGPGLARSAKQALTYLPSSHTTHMPCKCLQCKFSLPDSHWESLHSSHHLRWLQPIQVPGLAQYHFHELTTCSQGRIHYFLELFVNWDL